MKSSRKDLDEDEEQNESTKKRSKTTTTAEPNEANSSDENASDGEESDDAVTSNLALQNDLRMKMGAGGRTNPFAAKQKQKRLIVVLEKANLETVKIGTTYELLNCDRHKQHIIKYKKDPSECRPDILHQCLLM